MIPKIIHQIWIGPDPIPDRCKNYVETWKKLHPSWEYKFWDNTNIEELLSEADKNSVDAYNHHVNGRMFSPACQADIIRYLAVLKYGGVYIDIDFECYKPIDELILNKNLVVASPNSNVHWVCNGFFGATPGHEVLKNAVHDLKPRPLAHNGPTFFAKHFKKFIDCPYKTLYEGMKEKSRQFPNVNLIHPKYLFTKKKESFACHIALRSWLPHSAIQPLGPDQGFNPPKDNQKG